MLLETAQEDRQGRSRSGLDQHRALWAIDQKRSDDLRGLLVVEIERFDAHRIILSCAAALRVGCRQELLGWRVEGGDGAGRVLDDAIAALATEALWPGEDLATQFDTLGGAGVHVLDRDVDHPDRG